MTQTQFQSKAVPHILNYDLVATLLHFALSYSAINYIMSKVLAPSWSIFNSRVLSVEPVKSKAVKVDEMFDKYVLSETVDAQILPRSHQIVDASLATISRIVAPFNRFIAYTVFNNVLRTSPPKLGKDEMQIHYSATLLYALIVNIRELFWKTQENVAHSLSETYQQEVETAKSKVSHPVAQNLSASYNTATKSLHSLNESVIQPLRAQTQDIVSDMATATRNRASQVGHHTQTVVNGAVHNAEAKLSGTSTIVSALA